MPSQVFTIPFAGRNISIGQGYNSQTSVFPGTALQMGSVGADPSAPGQTVAYAADIIEDHEGLMKSLDMGASADIRYGTASGSAKVDFVEKSNYNSQCHFVVVSCVVQNPWTQGHAPSIPSGSAAEQLINSNRMDDFRTSFGDYFVRAILTGGEFYAVARVTSLDISAEQSLSTQLHAACNGGLAGGEFSAHYNTELQHTENHTEITINAYSASGAGVDNKLRMDVDALMQHLEAFPQIAGDHPIGYVAEVARYDTVPIDITPLDEIENLQIAIGDAQAKRLEWLTVKNDMEFAREYPAYFVDLPASDELKHVADAYTIALNQVMVHLAKLAGGGIRPATLFDTSTVDLPEVPVLNRVTSAPTFPLPDFTQVGTNNGPFQVAISQFEAAEAEAERLGLKFNVVNTSGLDGALLAIAGRVTSQVPAPGTPVTTGSTVTLVV